MVTNWTSRAWTDSHNDYFARNILTCGCTSSCSCGAGDPAGARAYNEHNTVGVSRPWPTLEDCIRWERQNSYPGATGAIATAPPEPLQAALDAAIVWVCGRCHLQRWPLDVDGVVDPDGAPVEVPYDVWLATVMKAVQLATRRLTPAGMAGSAELGNLIRVNGWDPDIEGLLAPHLVIGLA
ncbi:MAG: hypothetical protein ACRCW4_13420 [Candidatus Neomicrothrix subdominans]